MRLERLPAKRAQCFLDGRAYGELAPHSFTTKASANWSAPPPAPRPRSILWRAVRQLRRGKLASVTVSVGDPLVTIASGGAPATRYRPIRSAPARAAARCWTARKVTTSAARPRPARPIRSARARAAEQATAKGHDCGAPACWIRSARARVMRAVLSAKGHDQRRARDLHDRSGLRPRGCWRGNRLTRGHDYSGGALPRPARPIKSARARAAAQCWTRPKATTTAARPRPARPIKSARARAAARCSTAPEPRLRRRGGYLHYATDLRARAAARIGQRQGLR